MAPRKKFYIIDTNVLIHDPQAMLKFKGANVAIPAAVLEELDKFKSEGTDRGRNAREAIRQLDALREKGSLSTGVKLADGGTLMIIFYDSTTLQKTPPLIIRPGDNAILLTAFSFMQTGKDVIFISKDLNARVKADALGIKTEDYLKEHITEKEFYQGWTSTQVQGADLKREFPTILTSLTKNNEIKINEFVLLESKNNPENYRVFRYHGDDHFTLVRPPQFNWNINARNAQQLMALNLLLDHSIQFVCLLGPAGTGKTLLALLAALHEVTVTHYYERMLISRPVVPLGHDIGYLPGTVEEKIHSWMLPIYDNMAYITYMINSGGGRRTQEQEYEQPQEQGRHKHRHKHRGIKKHETLSLNHLIETNKISMEAITFMRGRSIPYQYIIIDEAQNLTSHEIKTLITRAGEGSKVVLTGDPYQIDSPYLNFNSNGIVIASEYFKGQKLFGSVFLNTSERSELSKLASELL